MKARPKLKLLKPAAPVPNNRVRPINKDEWAKERLAKFAENVKWASAAKAYRTVRHVTQQEVGDRYAYTGARIGQWESGHYFSWNLEKFTKFCQIINRIAEGR